MFLIQDSNLKKG